MEKSVLVSEDSFRLEDYQHQNGLFPASINSQNQIMNDCFWLRDNYYVWHSVSGNGKLKMEEGFRNLFDRHQEKIKYHSKNYPSQEWMHIHPLYDENFNEVTNEEFGWPWIQNDAVGNFLEVFASTKDKKRSDLLVDYLDNIRFWECPDYGFWERGPRKIRSSSLASVIRAYEIYEESFGRNEKIENGLESGIKKLKSILPFETKYNEMDLSLLSLIWPGFLNSDILNVKNKKMILDWMKVHEKEYGGIRYLGDTWNGKDDSQRLGNEMAWTLYNPWMFLCTKEKSYLKKSEEIKSEFGCIPEGFLDEVPNCTPCLFWSEAMHKIALRNNRLQ